MMPSQTSGSKSVLKRAALVFAAVAALVGVMATSGAAAPGTTTMVSDDQSGPPPTGDSHSASASHNARFVVFVSDADNLVPQDDNGLADVFVRDRRTGTIERVSVNSNELQARNGVEGSLSPSVSSDGRYVVFRSDATTLVQPDPNQQEFDVFVRDRKAGTTERVSVNSSEKPGLNGSSGAPSMSRDGRFVAFESSATNLVAGDANGKSDVFLRDRTAGTTERVSLTNSGAQGLNGDSLSPNVSTDGRYVAFQSDAPNLVQADINGASDIFVRDRTSGTTQRVSVANDGTEANAGSSSPSMRCDGRYVAFESDATNLVSDDLNGASDIFVRDRGGSGSTGLESASTSGVQGNGDSYSPSIKCSGTHGASVAFESDATNLVPGDFNRKTDVFIGGTRDMISVSSSSVKGNGDSGKPSVSSDDNHVIFESIADNLVAGDDNGKKDIFVRQVGGGGGPDRTPPKVDTVTPAANATEVPDGSNLTATFSEAMQPGSITSTTFKVVKQDTTTPIPAAVSYDAATKTATLDPSADLEPGNYTATVTIGARDLADNELDQNPTAAGSQGKSWKFTVVDAPPLDTTPPTVVSVTPAENATGVPVGTRPTVTFSEEMQPRGIFVSLVKRNPNGTTTPVATAIDYDAATKTATIIPNYQTGQDLQPGDYQATVTTETRDTAGNQLDQNPTFAGNQPKGWRFTVS